MKISEITAADILDFIRAENDMQSLKEMNLIMPAAKAYIKSYLKVDDSSLDSHEDLTIAYMVLCQHMYDNRTFAVDCKEANRVIESILGLHDKNLVG